jgi:hypothetical protein
MDPMRMDPMRSVTRPRLDFIDTIANAAVPAKTDKADSRSTP